MADLTPKEHLQPSLLDRLTDSNPDGKTDTLDERVMSFAASESLSYATWNGCSIPGAWRYRVNWAAIRR